MKHEIKKYFDGITSERSDEEFLRGAIERAEDDMKKHRTFKKAVIIPFAAAVTIAVCGVGVGAAYGFEHLTEVFKGNENITAEIQTNIFSDTDGHVSVTIEQLVSDGRHVHAAVHYEALDEVGQEWLSKDEVFLTNDYNCNELLNIKHLDENGNEENPGSYGSIEITEQRTETDRYFYTKCEVYKEYWDQDKLDMIFNYPMRGGLLEKAQFEIVSTLVSKEYKIVGNERSSKYLTPTHIDISALSYALYAHDDYGLVVTNALPNGGYESHISVSHEDFAREVSQKYAALVRADGERIALVDTRGSYNGEEWIWMSGEIINFDEIHNCWTADYSITFEFNELIGIEIDGVYYDLIAE